MLSRAGLLAVVLLASLCATVCDIAVAAAAAPPAHALWQREIGASGLRRSLANGATLGELQNRVLSYRVAEAVAGLRRARSAAGVPVSTARIDSRAGTSVAEATTLARLGRDPATPWLLHGIARGAGRTEDDRLDGRNDRLDLGLLRAVRGNRPGYVGLGIAVERGDGRLGFLSGGQLVTGVGPRLDAGRVLGQGWAASLRAERLWFSGEADIARPGPSGITRIEEERRFLRDYAGIEAIRRFPLDSGGRLRWRSGIHLVRSRYDEVIDSLGAASREPFGADEHLLLVRTGLQLEHPLGGGGPWSLVGELIYDREVATDLDGPVDDRDTLIGKLGFVRGLGRARRAQFELQRFQGLRDRRTRTSAVLVLIWDR